MKLSRLLLLVLVSAVAAIAAGCGSSSSSSSDHDPAALIPAGAPLYAEATIQPDGKVGSDLDAALKKILRTDDPGAKIKKALDDAGKRDDFSYANDIEPWLGDKAGIALTAVHGKKADFVAVINSKDDGKAADAIKKAKGHFETRNYKGFAYRIDLDDGTAAGVFDHAVVVGTESGFKSAVDASKGTSLAESNDLRAVRSKVAEDRVGLVYVDVESLLHTIGQASGTSGGAEFNALLQSASAAVPKTIGAAFQAQPDQLRIDAVSLGTPKNGSPDASGSEVLGTLPADSWLALGIGRSGEKIDQALQSVGSSGGIAGVGINALLGQLKSQTGLDLRQDVLSWMGDAGVFVSGTSLSDLGGALVVKTSDPAKTKRFITVLRRLVEQSGDKVSDLKVAGADDGFTVKSGGSPPVNVGLAGDKFIISAGSDAAFKQAISPGQPLSSSAAFTDASSKLGDGLKPSFFLDFQRVVSLIESAAGSQPDFQKAKPYLDTFGAVVAGAKDEGSGVTRARFVVTLR
jgi:hypothetical protein